jgi:hypothetical protein
MRIGAQSALGDGLLWPLLDPEGSMSFLFTKVRVPIEVWAEWSKNPATWRKRFPGESIGVTVPDS